MTADSLEVDHEIVRSATAGVPAHRADVVEGGSIFAGIVTPEGTPVWADPRFLSLIGDPSSSPDCVALIHKAVAERRAIGIVATLSRGTVAMSAEQTTKAGHWPLPPGGVAALDDGGKRILLLVFAPSRSPDVIQGAADALGLAPRETDLAYALLETPNLKAAAARAGMSHESAKDALARACRKAGVSGASELVARLLDLSCGVADDSWALVGAALGLTAAETAVALSVGRGESVEVTAAGLGLSPATVKSYRKIIFAKTGVTRDRDLRRLVAEAGQLERLASAQEIVLERRAPAERLRVVARPDGRRVVLIDYGPRSGDALIVMHGYQTGLRLPPGLLDRLHRDGWRPIVPQRPGFGLSDAAGGAYLATAVGDLAAAMDALGIDRAVLFARDGGAATAIEFAARHPDRFERGVLLNPRAPRDHPRTHRQDSKLSVLAKALLARPALLVALGDAVRLRTSSESVRVLLRRFAGATASDQLAVDTPAVVDHLVRDIQGLLARSSRGLVDELRLYAEGWTPPQTLTAGPWRVVHSAELQAAADTAAWSDLPGVAPTTLAEGGLLAAFTHPEAVAALLQDSDDGHPAGPRP